MTSRGEHESCQVFADIVLQRVFCLSVCLSAGKSQESHVNNTSPNVLFALIARGHGLVSFLPWQRYGPNDGMSYTTVNVPPCCIVYTGCVRS